jgi:uncharacterized protein (DUF2252 family)
VRSRGPGWSTAPGRIVDDPALIVDEDPESGDATRMMGAYVESLPRDRRPALDRYSVVDTARRVVGVGGVGTRCHLVLLMDADGRAPIFLQLR